MTDGRIVILGCGGSSGVPAPGPRGGNWGAGDPRQPRDRRRRASILIETETTRVLVDASPDLREQLIDVGADLDAIVFTHAHADHVHGVDDLRAACNRRGAALDAWAEPRTHDEIDRRFDYIYKPIRGDYFYKPTLTRRDVVGPFEIGDLRFTPFGQDHGVGGRSLGFRIGDFAYSTDVWMLDDGAFGVIAGVKTWIVGCLSRRPNPAHTHLARALKWIDRIGPDAAYLTHLGVSMGYDRLVADCPPGVAPAFDGLEIAFDASAV